jgi:membrane protease YdiL (CAAX protease family)
VKKAEPDTEKQKKPEDSGVGLRHAIDWRIPYNPFSAIILTIVGFFVAQFVGLMLIVVYSQIKGWEVSDIPNYLNDSAALNMSFTILIFLIFLLIIKSFLNSNKLGFRDIGLRLTKVKSDIIFYILGGFAFYFVFANFLALPVISKILSDDVLKQEQQLGYDKGAVGPELFYIFIGLVIIPPIVEEIVMRGFLYTGLRKKLNFWWSGLIVSILFGAAHLDSGGGAALLWVVGIDTFILSWVLVYVREKSGSLYPAIGIHMLKNLMAFLAIFIFNIAT